MTSEFSDLREGPTGDEESSDACKDREVLGLVFVAAGEDGGSPPARTGVHSTALVPEPLRGVDVFVGEAVAYPRLRSHRRRWSQS